jgi:chlorobactene glucosyltransferase
VIVVDDHSEDETATIARTITERDPRVRLIRAPALPNGWLGKQWACENGAMAANGSILLFIDADTAIGPELISRAVNAMRARSLDFLSVVGRQELRTFWERVVQPHILAMLALRFGGTGAVNRSRRPADKIANGQCIFMTRAAYEMVGRHASVRERPAEDVALAQRSFTMGLRTELIIGMDHIATRMYASLREIVDGWTKNIWTAAPEQMPGGRLGVLLLPLLMPLPSLMALAPPALLLVQLVVPVSTNVVAWAVLCTGTMVVFWAFAYAALAGFTPLYAFTFPLGSGVVLYIIMRAMVRGRRMEWKGRSYVVR